MASPLQPFLASARDRMEKSLEHFIQETRGIRTGRASAGLVEGIRVDYYGQKSPLNQIATITAPDPRSLVVKPFDPSSLKDIERAIVSSDLGLTASVEGKQIRIAVPPLSEEQRQKLAARCKKLAEEAKVAMRNVRRDVLKEVEQAWRNREGEVTLTEDHVAEAKEEVTKVLHEYEKKVDGALEAKTREILEV